MSETTFNVNVRRFQSFFALAIMVVALAFLSDKFLTFDNGWNILRQISVNLCLSVGMTLVILSGGIDLSVGAVVAFVGVMSHPYFAVSSATGQFRIAHVPAGSYTIKAWHEQFGERTQSVAVKPGGTARVDFTYSATGR